jgi:hypothetical protein
MVLQISERDMADMQLPRTKLIEYVREPFFADFVTGAYVRVSVKKGGSGGAEDKK